MANSKTNTVSYAKKKPSGKGKKKKKKVKLTTFGKILFTLLILGIIFFLVWGTYKLLNKKNKTDNNTEVTEIVKNDISASVKDIKKEEKKAEEIDNRDNKTKEEKKKEPEKTTNDKDTSKTEKPVAEHVNDKTNIKASINGYWLSTSEGAVLTMNDDSYSIDFAGIDASNPIAGTYKLQDKKIIFSTDAGSCKGEIGIYRIILDKHDIKFICEDDNCLKRKATLTTEWEWLNE